LARQDYATLLGMAESAEAGALPLPSLDLLGMALWEIGHEEAAADFLRRMQSQHPGDYRINFALAYGLFSTDPRPLDEVVRYYTAAVAIRPQSYTAHYGLGIAILRSGRIEESIPEYRAVLRLKPDYPSAHRKLSYGLWNTGHFDEAIAIAREGARLHPDQDAEWLAGLLNKHELMKQEPKR
jgi:tetratricopeptide (TPR) repeat protein